MAVRRYGVEKYGPAGVLVSSAGRGWSGLSAELRSHSGGVVARKSTQPDTEICVDMHGNGSVVTLAGAPESRREADRALQVLSSDPTLGPVVAIGDVRPQAILLELREVAESTSLFRGPLTALVAEDRNRGGLLLPTLRAYVDAFGDVPLAASRLRVHPNTFRYRLRKALAAVDFSDPDRRLVVQLQLRLQDFSESPRP